MAAANPGKGDRPARIGRAKIHEFTDVALPAGSGSAVRKISTENVPVPISSRERKL
jgi:hypothetical protein